MLDGGRRRAHLRMPLAIHLLSELAYSASLWEA